MRETDDLQSERTRLRRFPKRGHYDRATIDAILDAGIVCHLGFVHEGQPFVIPTAYARIGDRLLLHGSAASRAMRALEGGLPACVTVTHVDGIVLARTAFNHSFNYRSVVVLGVATTVEDLDDKREALRGFTERIVPGRWNDVRPPTAQELRATTVLTLPIDEASAKIREGPPGDEGDELEFRAWAGVVPFELCARPPIPDPRLAPDIPTPKYALAHPRLPLRE
ncbi:MAG: pyridoxamine 5'-phosphate oxidase family protein [Proteobacteria bacterium]|nr:MAG: pyridoxamine 5'-phosphate oxidase family protein [Pseudomonadota bacterium]